MKNESDLPIRGSVYSFERWHITKKICNCFKCFKQNNLIKVITPVPKIVKFSKIKQYWMKFSVNFWTYYFHQKIWLYKIELNFVFIFWNGILKITEHIKYNVQTISSSQNLYGLVSYNEVFHVDFLRILCFHYGKRFNRKFLWVWKFNINHQKRKIRLSR